MIAVDASVAVKWVLPDEDRADLAQELLDRTLASGESLIAPALLTFEVTNIVRQQIRRGIVDSANGLGLLSDVLDLPVERWSPPGLHERALILAVAFALPAAYDAHYVALAEFAGCDCWTDDRRLVRQVGGRLPALRWIGDARA